MIEVTVISYMLGAPTVEDGNAVSNDAARVRASDEDSGVAAFAFWVKSEPAPLASSLNDSSDRDFLYAGDSSIADSIGG
jgi:hypothetical protein